MRAIAGYTLAEAGGVLRIALLFSCLGYGLSIFMQQVAVTESHQIQAGTLALVNRLGSVFILVSFVLSGMIRDAQDKSLEFFLAMPISRTGYFFGRLLGYAAVCLLIAALAALPLFFRNSGETALLWSASLFMELILICSVCLFFSITLTQLPAALAAVAGFYLLARSMGTLLLLMNGPLAGQGRLQKAADAVFYFIGLLLPRLDEYTQSAWLVYPSPHWSQLLPIILQTVIYSGLMCAAALFDLHRREL